MAHAGVGSLVAGVSRPPAAAALRSPVSRLPARRPRSSAPACARALESAPPGTPAPAARPRPRLGRGAARGRRPRPRRCAEVPPPAAGSRRTAAELIAARRPPELLSSGTLVPVPPAPLRRAWRGFDPAGETRAALAAAHRRSAQHAACAAAAPPPGRTRARRAARAAAPRIEARRPVPERALLVDDVMTTGATLAACARGPARGRRRLDVTAVTSLTRPELA